MESCVQLLFIAERHTAGDDRGFAHLSLLGMAALLATGNALCCHRPGVELYRLGRRWLVCADGLRDVHHEGTQLPAAGTRQLYPDSHIFWRYPCAIEPASPTSFSSLLPPISLSGARLSRGATNSSSSRSNPPTASHPHSDPAAAVNPPYHSFDPRLGEHRRAYLPASCANPRMPGCAARSISKPVSVRLQLVTGWLASR